MKDFYFLRNLVSYCYFQKHHKNSSFKKECFINEAFQMGKNSNVCCVKGNEFSLFWEM